MITHANEQYYTVSDVAREIGRGQSWVSKLVRAGRFPRPTREVPGFRKKYYSREDFTRLKEYRPAKSPHITSYGVPEN